MDGDVIKEVNSMNIGEILTFDYIGDIQTVILESGIYKLECWGGQGNKYSIGYNGGNGGYSCGEITLSSNTILYIFVGDGGKISQNGGWNGGGNGGNGNWFITGGGGGASDIRIGGIELINRILVAGGGGGGGYYDIGGVGGGLVGGDAYAGGKGGTQTEGGLTGGTLGIGGYDTRGGGGGGGYYGGGGSLNYDYGGGGGSSYYNAILSNISTSSGVKSGTGQVKITAITINKNATRGSMYYKTSDGNWKRVIRCR